MRYSPCSLLLCSTNKPSCTGKIDSVKEQQLCLKLEEVLFDLRACCQPLGQNDISLNKESPDVPLMQTLTSLNPSLHLTKHTSYSHLTLPRNFGKKSPGELNYGRACNNVISVAITKKMDVIYCMDQFQASAVRRAFCGHTCPQVFLVK